MKPDNSLRAVFSEALDRHDAAERTRYLDEACGADAALRQRVEKLLQAHDEAGGFLSHPSQPPEGAAAGQPSPLSEKAGDRVGRYKLLQQIGEGGCGVVYMAEQETPVRRRVALKLIKLGMDTKEVLARFEAERQALALMDHPNIARVLEAGAADSGRPFFVMELVRGVKITQFCDEQKLSTHKRLELFMSVCSAIQHAHQKGVIHRDLKPSNILVTTVDGAPVPKVIDFGIAKATNNQPLTDKTVFTAFDQFIGTPAYMSPEQAEMSGVDIDTRTDIYSLGVVLYELLTGKPPFDAEQFRRASLDEIRHTIRDKVPLKPSTRLHRLAQAALTTVAEARQTNPSKLIDRLRGDLDWVVMKCLEKDRNRRYETANGLGLDIRRHLDDEPVVARPPGKFYRFQKLVRRNKLAFTASTAVVVALLLGIAGITSQAVRASRAGKIARQHQAHAEQEAIRADAHAASERRARAAAEQQRALAERRSRELAHSLYASQMNAAFQSWEDGNVSRVLELLREHQPKPGDEDLRGFEWHYLERLCHAEQLTLRGHNAPMRSVAFSPDGSRLATAGDDSTARVWDARTGQELLTLRGHTNWVTAVAFAPDGKTLATGSGDQTARLWDAATGQELATLRGHTQAVTAIAFTPDGKLLATATGALPTGRGNPRTRLIGDRSPPATIKLWQLADRTELRTLTGHSRSILALAISPDGKMLATGGADRMLKLWEIETGRRTATFTNFSGAVFAVAFSPNGLTLAAGGGDPYRKVSELRLYDVSAARSPMLFEREGSAIFCLAFAPDGKTLATAGLDHVVRCWDTRSGKQILSLKGHTAPVWSLAYDPGGQRLATASWDRTVKLWAATARQEFALLPGAGGYSINFSPNGELLVCATSSSGLKIFELDGAKPPFLIPHSWVIDPVVAFSPTGAILACAGADGVVALWEVGLWRRLATLKGHKDRISSLAFSPDGRTLATGSRDTTVRLWDVAEHRERAVIRGSTSIVTSLVFTPDGKTLLAAGAPDVLFIDPVKGQVETKLAGRALRLALSPDGRFLAISHGDARLTDTKLIDLTTRATQWAIKAHPDQIYALAFSPDGRTVATASWDGTAKLWHAATGQEMFTYEAGDVVWSLAFSPDNRRLAVGSGSDAGSRVAIFFHGAAPAAIEAGSPGQIQPRATAPARGALQPICSTPAELAGRLPARDPRARPESVDLTAHYNAALTDGWTDGNPTNNFSPLPRGLPTFAGVEFDVRGLVQLRCAKAFTEPFPQAITNILVGRACRKLHFLHAASTSFGTATGTIIGRFRIHPSGSRPAEMPIRFGDDVRDWWVTARQQPRGADLATIAWTGTNASGQALQVFKSVWENPDPARVVERIDYVSAMTTAAPFLIAITAEP